MESSSHSGLLGNFGRAEAASVLVTCPRENRSQVQIRGQFTDRDRLFTRLGAVHGTNLDRAGKPANDARTANHQSLDFQPLRHFFHALHGYNSLGLAR